MARSDQAKVKRTAIFVKERTNGKDSFIRRPYDLVEYNWGNGEIKTYLQPHPGSAFSKKLGRESYDDVRTFNTPPDWDIVKP